MKMILPNFRLLCRRAWLDRETHPLKLLTKNRGLTFTQIPIEREKTSASSDS